MENNQVMDAEYEFPGIDNSRLDYLYDELWKLSAGPLFDLPKFGEKVYYFPQGHIEHLEAHTKDELSQLRPIFDIPSRIGCSVIDIQLKVENETDEVFAKIALLPDTAEVEIPISNVNHERIKVSSFIKVLTASDTSTHGGLSVIKRHAVECLPPLDMSQPTPSQEIVAKDLHGCEWKFKHIFRGSPLRHIFTTGWSGFATSKRLVTGDSFIFLRGENGESRVGIRRAVHQQRSIPLSIISKESMHHGITATAMNAINTKSMFIVFCKLRSSQFIVNFDKVVDAVNNKFYVGSRFTMRFENYDFTVIRYSGTIIGKKDFSSHWRDSEWRCLEVQWDEPALIPRPNKVSSWEIEHMGSSSNVHQSALLKNKRSRQAKETSSNLWPPTLTQGQEIGQSTVNFPMSVPPLSYCDATDSSNISSGWPIGYSVPTMPKPNYNNEMVMSVKEKMTTAVTTANYRLFGVDLTSPRETEDPIRQIDSYQKSEMCKITKEKNCDQIQTRASPKEIQSKSTRSRIKVHMQGVAIGRAVDLTILDGYNQLIDELEKLFDLKDELHTRNQWEIIFTDDEGDMMLVGDDPWPKFCNMVKKIFICSKEEVGSQMTCADGIIQVGGSVEGCEGSPVQPQSEAQQIRTEPSSSGGAHQTSPNRAQAAFDPTALMNAFAAQMQELVRSNDAKFATLTAQISNLQQESPIRRRNLISDFQEERDPQCTVARSVVQQYQQT
ncbi:hypothetical protein EUTSA_v10029379mg [Eutrema salsugineum]|uniref:Auxin response factor n=1 Tax=Eutrema salsugineum TaxID=72664 RepID=V4KKN9_EUTSA|nr:hypothetical protein EUTSA_v10029379mg [Eutrema salsugineum]